MSVSRLELTGHTFGRWTVLHETNRPLDTRDKGVFWLCRCSCGTLKAIPGSRLNAGRGLRGCDQCRSHLATRGKMTPEYQSWRGMRERCLNPNHSSFSRYGGRGIKVCDRWLHSFPNFLADMGKRPDRHSLDRINVEGHYEPDNCRWADAKTQARNSSHFVLSDEQVDAILRLLASGALQIDIAQAVGVSRSHIANIAIGNARAA